MDTDPIPLRPARARSAGSALERLGPEHCESEELVAAVLGDGAGARRTARRLLDRFGSVRALTRATQVELRVAGLSEVAAARVVAAAEIGRRGIREWPAGHWVVRMPADAAEPLLEPMGSLEREELRVLLLDTKNVVVGERTVYRGNLAGSSVRVGEVFRDAVRSCAAAIVVVHNHPSGDPAGVCDEVGEEDGLG
jgi:DNA repair protein RadC